MESRRLFAATAAVVLLGAACGGDDDTATVDEPAPTAAAEPTPTTAAEPTATPAPEPTATAGPTATPAPEPTPEPRPELALELPGLPALGGDSTYEAWLLVADQPVSAGTFDLADGTAALALGVEHEGATAVVITIETDDDPAPAATHVLAGPLQDGQAQLTVTDPAAVGADFADAAGTYILATPTDGTGPPENERSGVWWTFMPRAQSLFLPELPEGWIYEGWQVIDGVPVTSGTFTTLFGEPDDAAPFSGPEPGPPFPGEDYVTNAPDGLTFPRDLRGTEVVITVEPVPDTDPGPFPLVPLRGTVPADAQDHTHYEVDNVADQLPVGTATIG